MNVENRTLFIADNLDILRGIDSETIDLIYLDPPFNTKKQYRAPIGTRAEGAEFKDIWTDEDIKHEWVGEIAQQHQDLYQAILASEVLYDKSMRIYLTAMAIRLFEMQRILKPTGSIYLHCDPTASHYLKFVMDSIFGKDNFLADITWKRYAPHSLSKSAVDTISEQLLYYAQDHRCVVANTATVRLDTAELNERFSHIESETGRRFQHVALEQSSNSSSAGEPRNIGGRVVTSAIGWRWTQSTFDERIAQNPYLIYWTRNGRPRYKIYADEYKGAPVGNIWTDIPYLASGDAERTGYPTQKPLALLKRIIKASSSEGDVVLDPFCGCATACVAAEKLGRQWIGIDISPSAEDITRIRLEEEVDVTRYDTDSPYWFNPIQDVTVRSDPPDRTTPPEPPGQMLIEELFRTENVGYSDEQLVVFLSEKHRMYGNQEGKCNGCQVLFPFRNLTIDHIIPKSIINNPNHQDYPRIPQSIIDNPDNPDNLQLLCAACNSTKGDRPQEYLISKLREDKIIS